MALNDRELSTAEVAFAAIDEVSQNPLSLPALYALLFPFFQIVVIQRVLLSRSRSFCHSTCLALQVSKLQYVLAIKEIPTTEGRNAELALWRRRPDDAERILLQAKLPPPY